jgi:hypothetical protein
MSAEPHTRLEVEGIDAVRVIALAAGVLLFLSITITVLALIFFAAPRSNNATPLVKAAVSNNRVDLPRLMREQQANLNGYRWIDKNSGVIGIPLDRAMQLIAERGAAGYEPLVAPPGSAPPQGGGSK